ncbi:MAG: hypothetical protein LQ351_006997, partial [Letrouitia transgressa]
MHLGKMNEPPPAQPSESPQSPQRANRAGIGPGGVPTIEEIAKASGRKLHEPDSLFENPPVPYSPAIPGHVTSFED